jgi:hypothetical protein
MDPCNNESVILGYYFNGLLNNFSLVIRLLLLLF